MVKVLAARVRATNTVDRYGEHYKMVTLQYGNAIDRYGADASATLRYVNVPRVPVEH
jgi:hypothetical protein